MDHLRGQFKGLAGRRILERYYDTVRAGPGGAGFVAQIGPGVVGFVCGVWDSPAIKREMIKRHWGWLIIWTGIHLAVHPSVLHRFLPLPRTGSIRSSVDLPIGYELRPIVVSPSARGTGIAFRLVETLLADAADRGFDSIYLLTEPDNAAAKKFYLKAGFSLTGSAVRGGTDYLVYTHEVARSS